MTFEELQRIGPGNWFYDVGDQLKWSVYRRSEEAFAAGDAARDAIATPADLAARQAAARASFLGAIGGLPASDCPLAPRYGYDSVGEGHTVKRLMFQSRRDVWVTANLYLPLEPRARHPAVLFLCGHAQEAKGYPEYQAVCQRLALAGLVVLAQDPIGQGERLSYWEPALGAATVGACCPEHDYAGAQCALLGQNLARYMLHDALRGIEFLRSLSEVDGERIGVTGNSGGGLQTSFVMLADPTIAAAAPGTFIMSRRSYMHTGGAQDAEQIWPGFTAAGFDHEDILLAMAPRPVCVLAVTDDFFPIDGTRRTVDRCRRIWGIAGAPDALTLAEDRSGHAYTPVLARAAVEFFCRALGVQVPACQPDTVATLPAQATWVTLSGQVRGEVPGASAVHEAVVGACESAARERAARPEAERRTAALSWLARAVWGVRRTVDLVPRFYAAATHDDLSVRWAIWWSEADLLGHGACFRPAGIDEDLPTTVAIWDGGVRAVAQHAEWIRRECAEDRAVLVLDCRGVGALAPHSLQSGYAPQASYGVIHKLADDMAWLGDDLCAARAWDVLRALEVVRHWPGLSAARPRLHCRGRHGVYGRIAAAIAADPPDVQTVDGLESYGSMAAARHYNAHDIKSLVLRDVLLHCDLPDLDRWCSEAAREAGSEG